MWLLLDYHTFERPLPDGRTDGVMLYWAGWTRARYIGPLELLPDMVRFYGSTHEGPCHHIEDAAAFFCTGHYEQRTESPSGRPVSNPRPGQETRQVR